MSSNAGKPIVRIDVSGKDPEVWAKLRERLLDAVYQVLNTVIDAESGGTVRMEGQRAFSALFDNLKCRLKRAGFENEKIQAEVAALYAKCEVSIAHARKTNAEAAALEFDTAVKRLKTALGLCRALTVSTKDEEAVIFSSQIEAMMATVDDMLTEREKLTDNS
jgi:hypothetical protein